MEKPTSDEWREMFINLVRSQWTISLLLWRTHKVRECSLPPVLDWNARPRSTIAQMDHDVNQDATPSLWYGGDSAQWFRNATFWWLEQASPNCCFRDEAKFQEWLGYPQFFASEWSFSRQTWFLYDQWCGNENSRSKSNQGLWPYFTVCVRHQKHGLQREL